MHRAAHYLAGLFPKHVKKTVVEAYVLSPADVAAVGAGLPVDASDYLYSACLSIVDGLRGVDCGFYTWATVKFYYSLFYSLRAILAWENVAVFRTDERTPFHVRAIAGSGPVFAPGKGSHKSMLNCFRTLNPTHFLISQPVDTGTNDGLEWLLEKRENANYAIPRFSEPDIPTHYEQILRIGIRRAVSAYLDPSQSILTFDREHAVVSFPLAAFRFAGSLAQANGGADIGLDEFRFLVKKCKERSGALSPLMTYIRTIIPQPKK